MLIQFSSYMAMMAAIMATYNWFNPLQNSPDLDKSEGTSKDDNLKHDEFYLHGTGPVLTCKEYRAVSGVFRNY